MWNSSVGASNHFKQVITIENSKVYFEEALNSYKHLQNIEFLFGDSRSVLKKVVTKIREPAIFWLDAHWCSMDSYGSNDQCPIIDEINLIRSTGIKHYIFIDDARLFLSPPPLPNKTEQWPTIDQICNNIQLSCLKSEAYHIVVFEDVIMAAPDNARSLVVEYCQAANTKAWIEQGMRIVPNGLDLINQGVRVIARDAWVKLKQAIHSKEVSA
ncbi:MAG: hypothetical protein NTY86_09385 [Deltaproteobacteria bacterium]|nr:hypothetical protein [Deltaproteobacteria bacterium]